MQLRNTFSLLTDLTYAIKIAFIPTIRDLTREPSLIIHPVSVSRIFMSHVWAFFGNAINENCREIKNALLYEDARGVVLDLGAGLSRDTPDFLSRILLIAYRLRPHRPPPRHHQGDEIRRPRTKYPHARRDPQDGQCGRLQ